MRFQVNYAGKLGSVVPSYSIPFACFLSAIVLILTACGSIPGQTNSPSGKTSNQQTQGSAIVGKWTGHCRISGVDFSQAEFDDNGTLVLDNTVMQYTTSTNTVRFVSQQNTLQYTYAVSLGRNGLTLTDTKGIICVIVRAGSDAGNIIAKSLVGVWIGDVCHFNIGMGFHQIEFRSDGTALLDGDDGTMNGTNSGFTYSLLDYSHIGFTYDNFTQSWSFSVTLNTLKMTNETNPTFDTASWPTCSLQKTA